MMIQGNSSANNRERLGGNLRRLRIAHHLSLSQLARDTGVSKGTLSAIESGRGNPTVDTLTLLAEALEVSIAEMLQDTAAAEMLIVRMADAQPWPPQGAALRRLESSAKLGGNLEVLELALPPHHVHEGQLRSTGARERVLVLQGKVIAGPLERISELASGDYASFPADVAHVYETGRLAARVLTLKYTPS